MSTVLPAVPEGETAVIWVSLTILKTAAGVEPKLTAVAPLKVVPVIVTAVPPAGGPNVGETDATTGRKYVNWSATLVALLAPPVTVMSTVPPAVPAGETAVIWVSLTILKLAAGV
jgi:hypothetical protein